MKLQDMTKKQLISEIMRLRAMERTEDSVVDKRVKDIAKRLESLSKELMNLETDIITEKIIKK